VRKQWCVSEGDPSAISLSRNFAARTAQDDSERSAVSYGKLLPFDPAVDEVFLTENLSKGGLPTVATVCSPRQRSAHCGNGLPTAATVKPRLALRLGFVVYFQIKLFFGLTPLLLKS